MAPRRKVRLISRDSREPSDCRKIRSHGSSVSAASGHDGPARHKRRAVSAWWPPGRTGSTGPYGISVITEMELLAWPSLTPAEEKTVREFLGQLVVCELTRAIRARAVQLRKEHHLKLPDAIVCATAKEFGVELWTNDTTLTRVPGLNCRTVNVTKI
jgi:predicted nucleic acid-binding protein